MELGKQAALEQGQIAVWSILRDWIKGQLMAIENEILSFDAAFLGQILLPSGKTVHEQIEEKNMLPALEAPKGEWMQFHHQFYWKDSPMTDANTEPKRKPTEIAPEDKPPRDMDEERKKFGAG